MAISLKHSFTSPKADGTDSTLVQPSNWNAEHTITLAAGKVLGRDSSGTGTMQELPISVDSTGQSLIPPSGTTGQRPATAAAGMLRYNTTLSKIELYNGTAWGSVGGGGATVSDTAPSAPSAGDLWWKSDEGQMYIYYNDGSSTQWVIANAFTNANAFVPLTGGTMTGDLYVNTKVGVGTTSPNRLLTAWDSTYTNNYQLSLGGSSGISYDIGRNTSTGWLTFYGNQSTVTGYVFGGVDGERFRIASAGQFGIGGANYGTSGQVLTSGGASAAPSWSTLSSSFGSSTAWAAVTRTSGTTYTNSLSTAVMFKVTGAVNGLLEITVNGVKVQSTTGQYSNTETGEVIVPPGATYMYTAAGVLGTWLLS
jgi:hypothetical protein